MSFGYYKMILELTHMEDFSLIPVLEGQLGKTEGVQEKRLSILPLTEVLSQLVGQNQKEHYSSLWDKIHYTMNKCFSGTTHLAANLIVHHPTLSTCCVKNTPVPSCSLFQSFLEYI